MVAPPGECFLNWPFELPAMAAMELPPRRSRKQHQEITIQRNRSALDVLMQMGFPKHRAWVFLVKASVSTLGHLSLLIAILLTLTNHVVVVVHIASEFFPWVGNLCGGVFGRVFSSFIHSSWLIVDSRFIYRLLGVYIHKFDNLHCSCAALCDTESLLWVADVIMYLFCLSECMPFLWIIRAVCTTSGDSYEFGMQLIISLMIVITVRYCAKVSGS